jgi:NADH-quinone oxidoreductase subunit G
MCDHGRLNIKDVAAENRLIGASVDGKPSTTDAALDRIESALKDADGAGVVGIVSARLTNEECWLGRRLLRGAAGSPNLDVVPREHEGDNFLLTEDRNPNTTGARAAGISPEEDGFGLDGLKASVEAGQVKALVIVGDEFDERAEDLALLEKIPFVAVIGSHDNETTKRAHAVLPGATWAEKGGTVTNLNGRVQKLQPLVRLPGQAKPDSHWLLQLLHRMGDEAAPDVKASPPALFRAMTKDVEAFGDLTWKVLGEQGALMRGATESADAQGGVPV